MNFWPNGNDTMILNNDTKGGAPGTIHAKREGEFQVQAVEGRRLLAL